MVEQREIVSDAVHVAWAGLVSEGISNAIRGLSEMVGTEMVVSTLHPRLVELKEVPYLFGGPEALTVGIYLSVSGGAEGQILLAYKPEVAFEMLDLLMGDPTGTTQSLGEMEESGLGEMGNIMGAFFLNSLADVTGVKLLPSPPSVMMDMAGAILDGALAEFMQIADDAWIVESTFGTQDRQICGAFLVLPSPSLLGVLSDHLNSKS